MGYESGLVRILNTKNRESIDWNLSGTIEQLKVSARGKWLCAKVKAKGPHHEETTFFFWDSHTKKQIDAVVPSSLKSGDGVSLVEFTPDERFVFMQTARRKLNESIGDEVTLLELNSGKTWIRGNDPKRETYVDWHPHDHLETQRQIAFIDSRAFIARGVPWRINETLGLEKMNPHVQLFSGLAVAAVPGKNRLVVQDRKATGFRLWNSLNLEPLSPVIGHDRALRSIAMHPNGRTIAVGDVSGHIRLWDGITGRQVSPLLFAPNGEAINLLTFSHDASALISRSSGDGTSKREFYVWPLPEFPSDLGVREDLLTLAERIARRQLDKESGFLTELTDEDVLKSWRASKTPIRPRD